MTTNLQAPTATTARKADTRTYWRVLLAVVAPLPLLGQGLSYAFSTVDGGDDFATTVASMQAHHGNAVLTGLLNILFVVLLIPATVALALTTRRRAPKLTAVGATICLLGFLPAFPLLPNDNVMALVTGDKGLDVATVAALDDAIWAQPQVSLASLLFIVGIVIGLPILGIALWRAKAAPVWMAVCLILGTLTHPFMPGHLAAGLGLLVGAVGFVGVSRALFRTPNEAFDVAAL